MTILEAASEQFKSLDLEFMMNIQEFVETFGEASADLLVKLAFEESRELVEAVRVLNADPSIDNMEGVLKELGDYLYVIGQTANRPLPQTFDEEFIGTDVATFFNTYRNAGQLASELVELQIVTPNMLYEILARIHTSNMSKLSEDGEVLRDESGKVLKSPEYEEPPLNDLAQEAMAGYLAIRLLSMAENYISEKITTGGEADTQAA